MRTLRRLLCLLPAVALIAFTPAARADLILLTVDREVQARASLSNGGSDALSFASSSTGNFNVLQSISITSSPGDRLETRSTQDTFVPAAGASIFGKGEAS